MEPEELHPIETLGAKAVSTDCWIAALHLAVIEQLQLTEEQAAGFRAYMKEIYSAAMQKQIEELRAIKPHSQMVADLEAILQQKNTLTGFEGFERN